jgi:UDP-glucuronate 4-epimerase
VSNRILVTGGAGFIGSHVSEALLLRGDSVVILDNFNDYYDPERKKSNLDELEQGRASSGSLTVIEGDIRDRGLLGRLFVQNGFDAVVHLAAMAGVRASLAAPHLYYDVNLTGTLNLLEACRETAVNRFVFASTSSVYGDTKTIPFVETDPCDRPLAPYAASKRAGEMLGYTYHHLYGVNFTALRFFTVYGPRGRPDMMMYKVAENILFGREVPLYNQGQMYRDWTYVSDITRGVVAAVDHPLGYEVVNLGRGEAVLLADAVRRVEELAGGTACLVPAPMPDTDIPYTFADVGKARRLLGYEPGVSFHDGITRFWEWFRMRVADRRF